MQDPSFDWHVYAGGQHFELPLQQFPAGKGQQAHSFSSFLQHDETPGHVYDLSQRVCPITNGAIKLTKISIIRYHLILFAIPI